MSDFTPPSARCSRPDLQVKHILQTLMDAASTNGDSSPPQPVPPPALAFRASKFPFPIRFLP